MTLHRLNDRLHPTTCAGTEAETPTDSPEIGQLGADANGSPWV